MTTQEKRNAEGKVRYLSVDNSFGISYNYGIIESEGEDYRFSPSDVQGYVNEGDPVYFDVVMRDNKAIMGGKEPRVTNVRRSSGDTEKINTYTKMMPNKDIKGKVKWYNSEKGYGFLKPEGGDGDLLFIDRDRALEGGDPVCFDFIIGDKGPKAVNVRRI